MKKTMANYMLRRELNRLLSRSYFSRKHFNSMVVSIGMFLWLDAEHGLLYRLGRCYRIDDLTRISEDNTTDSLAYILYFSENGKQNSVHYYLNTDAQCEYNELFNQISALNRGDKDLNESFREYWRYNTDSAIVSLFPKMDDDLRQYCIDQVLKKPIEDTIDLHPGLLAMRGDVKHLVEARTKSIKSFRTTMLVIRLVSIVLVILFIIVLFFTANDLITTVVGWFSD